MIAAPRLAAATIILFVLSTVIPIAASLTPGTSPAWLGAVDLILAAMLIIALALLHVRANASVTTEMKAMSYDLARWIALVPLILFMLYVAGLHLKWDVLLIGLGWRAWYLVTVLPMLRAVRGRA